MDNAWHDDLDIILASNEDIEVGIAIGVEKTDNGSPGRCNEVSDG